MAILKASTGSSSGGFGTVEPREDRRARYAREKGIRISACAWAPDCRDRDIPQRAQAARANSTEFDPKCAEPVINMMEEQKPSPTRRHDASRSYDCALTRNLARRLRSTLIRERHRTAMR